MQRDSPIAEQEPSRLVRPADALPDSGQPDGQRASRIGVEHHGRVKPHGSQAASQLPRALGWVIHDGFVDVSTAGQQRRCRGTGQSRHMRLRKMPAHRRQGRQRADQVANAVIAHQQNSPWRAHLRNPNGGLFCWSN